MYAEMCKYVCVYNTTLYAYIRNDWNSTPLLDIYNRLLQIFHDSCEHLFLKFFEYPSLFP